MNYTSQVLLTLFFFVYERYFYATRVEQGWIEDRRSKKTGFSSEDSISLRSFFCSSKGKHVTAIIKTNSAVFILFPVISGTKVNLVVS